MQKQLDKFEAEVTHKGELHSSAKVKGKVTKKGKPSYSNNDAREQLKLNINELKSKMQELKKTEILPSNTSNTQAPTITPLAKSQQQRPVRRPLPPIPNKQPSSNKSALSPRNTQPQPTSGNSEPSPQVLSSKPIPPLRPITKPPSPTLS
jgi:hypothetical protein